MVTGGGGFGEEDAFVQVVDMSGQGRTCPTLSDFPFPAYNPAMALTNDMPVLCGGNVQFIGSANCYIYNNVSDSWSLLAQMETARDGPTGLQV